MDADREIEDAFRDAEEFHPLRNADDDPLSSPSDDAIALRFSERQASGLRFSQSGVSGCAITVGNGGMTTRCMLVILLEMSAACPLRSSITKPLSRSKAPRRFPPSKSLARADRRLAATVDQWDADPWLLNTPDGVVDLKTGGCRPHRMICGLRPRGRFRVKGSGFVKDRTGFVKDRKSAKKRGKAGFRADFV